MSFLSGGLVSIGAAMDNAPCDRDMTRGIQSPATAAPIPQP